MLWQSWRIDDNAGALDQIKRLLGSADPREVVAGLQSLGRLGEPKYAYLLRDFLGDSDSSVRAAALHAVSGLASSAGSSLLPELTVVIEHGGPEDRRLAFEAIERIGDSSVIETLLLRANAYTPAERRRIERLILEFGPRTVPLLTTIAQSPRFPVAARCVALRAIGKLSFPQVESLARPLIATTLSRAYLFLGSYLALARGDVGETGRAVLTRIYRDFPTLAIEIVLETLTIAGRLPGYEGPLAALQGGLSKERGYAIETIEQACDRKLFNLLLPLIDGRSLEAQVEFALSHELLPELDADAVLSRSLASEFPLEAAATVQALHAMAPDRNGDSLIAKLRQFPHPMLRTTILTLLARQAGEPAGLTPVEIVRELMAMPAMAGALFLHHEALVGQVRLVQPADGTRLFTAGGPADGLWQVLAGEVRTQDPDARHGAGATLGLADFYAGGPCRQTAVAAGPGTRLLHIPAEALRRCIEIHPAFGLALLRHKLTA